MEAATASARDVVVPDIGDFEDVPVIEILVSEGDVIAQEDPLVTLESEKATMDVPAPFEGIVRELKVSVGDKVSEGSVIMTVAPNEGDQAVATETLVSPAADEAASAPSGADGTPAPEATPEAGEAQGRGASGNGASAPPAPAPAARVEESPPPSTPETAETAGRAETSAAQTHASPSVRRLARELEIDLSQIPASGPKGRITKDDLRSFLSGPAPAPAAAPASTDGAGLGLAPWPRVDFAKFGPVERRPLTRIQKISGPALHRNWVMIPHVTHQDEADITDLEAFRKSSNEAMAKQGVKLTMVAFLLKASVAALKRFPDFNASLDGDELVLKSYYHLGFAADTPQGLVVPVIGDVDQKGLAEIATELGTLSGQAREGKLKPGDMQGGTFTISSLGGIGGTGFTPIVNAPEVAILGVTRSTTKPVWRDGQFVPRLIVPLSLSYDHRVIDGAKAARFTAYLADVLSDLRKVLL